MIDKRVFGKILTAFLIGFVSMVSMLLLLSQNASARPTLVQVDLLISKSANTNNVEVGDQLIYSLTYTASSTTTVNTIITDTFDPRLGYVSASISPSGTGNVRSWTIPVSGSVSGTIVLTVSVPLTMSNDTILTNDVIFDSAGAMPALDQITTTVDAPTLALTKRDYVDPVPTGAPLTYTLTYSNTGDANATNVVITDVLDDNVTFVSASPAPTVTLPSTLSWSNIGPLFPLTPKEIVITVTVKSGLGEGATITNVATIDSQQTDPFSQTVTTKVSAHGDAVSVTLAPPTDTITGGKSITYTLTAHDDFGNDWDVTAIGSFSIEIGAGGFWATNNVYASEKQGTWMVTGTYSSWVNTAMLTVTNAHPVIEDVSHTIPVNEGSSTTVTVTASDPNDDTLSYGFDWNNDGDFGDPGETASQTSNQLSHSWNDDSVYTIRVQVSDGDTNITTTHQITVSNVAPTITGVSNDGPVDEGSPVTIAITATDPSSDTLSHTYDWNDDGDFVDPGETLNSYTWSDEGSYTITVQVSDGDGGTVTDTTAITVLNVAPTITDVSNDGPVDEGSPVTIAITATDPSSDTLSYAYDWNNDGDFVDPGETLSSYTWFDEGSHTITVQVSDGDGGTVTDTTAITVLNVAPTITDVSNDGPVDEGSPVTI
ncbi:MAG: DUF11 domain-containing protein, partial [Chloroflexi bacterium]|nr:DUF11 domain-containing protein [Chloroflexota bacterium]